MYIVLGTMVTTLSKTGSSLNTFANMYMDAQCIVHTILIAWANNHPIIYGLLWKMHANSLVDLSILGHMLSMGRLHQIICIHSTPAGMYIHAHPYVPLYIVAMHHKPTVYSKYDWLTLSVRNVELCNAWICRTKLKSVYAVQL